MSSDLSTVSLKINQVNSSDTGLYFCGYAINTSPVIMDWTYLRVEGEIALKSFGTFKPAFEHLHWVSELVDSSIKLVFLQSIFLSSPTMKYAVIVLILTILLIDEYFEISVTTMILGGLISFLMVVVIGLAVRISKLQR